MVQTRSQAKTHEHHGYEFGGPIGTFLLTLVLPPLCYVFAFACNDVTGCPAPSLLHPYSLTLDKLKQDVGWPGFTGLIHGRAFLATLGWYGLTFVLWAVLPAQVVQGTELRSGGRIKYRMNAFYSALFTLTILAAGTITQGPTFPVWTFINDNYVQLLTSNTIIAFSLAIFIYLRSLYIIDPLDPPNTPGKSPSKKTNSSNIPIASKMTPDGPNRELAAGGNSGNPIYDFFIGRELNPPITIPLIGTVELKSFMELRPGMLGWMVLNLAFAARQRQNFGVTTDSMLIVLFSQGVYIVDAYWNEPAILTTIDITTDGFGFMLAFGDLVWLPFTYSLQARYLSVHPVRLGLAGCLAVFAVQGLGYAMFRAANSQKNAFRTSADPDADPAVKHLSYIQTQAGTRLLTSGWWGAARHVNYLADWLMSWSYVLPTGVAGYVLRPSSAFRDNPPEGNSAIIRDDNSLRGGVEVVPGEARGWGMLITYFFMVYFVVLLVHRERRDNEKCKRKYGKDWDEYCRRVPSRIVPYVY